MQDGRNDMPTLTPPNEWVSVEERLPDEELKRFKELFLWENAVEVLVMIQGAYTATTLYWDGKKFNDEMSSFEVTHWMPLPAPPGKDNNVPTKAQNEPLTIEQLREMNGEPVWLDVADGVWALVDANDDCVWLDRGGSININKLAEKVYRRPPERQEDT